MDELEREPVVPDVTYKVELVGETVYLSPVYDHIAFWPGFGHFVLKVLDEEGDMQGYHMTASAAKTVNEKTGVPYALREDMHESEYQEYLTFMSSKLDDTWLK